MSKLPKRISMKNRTTSDFIDVLEPNEIFVFGSNTQGMHAGGAARLAVDKFGATPGVSTGEQGQSYAIPTLDFLGLEPKNDSPDKTIRTRRLGLIDIWAHVQDFSDHAKLNPDKVYLVTEIGCGIAGFTVEVIAPMFSSCVKINNVHLPKKFWEQIMQDVRHK